MFSSPADIMKLHSTLLAFFYATVVSAQAQAPLRPTDDGSLDVPGNSTLKVSNFAQLTTPLSSQQIRTVLQ
jgi:hypothetical protein